MTEPYALLTPVSGHIPQDFRLPCIALAHNEGRILPDFLRHYRGLGVDHFFIVDDRSTDDSQRLLAAQADVSLFTPVESSSYSRHKRHWRAELLDRYCNGRWAVVPDIDEHLVFRDCERRDLDDLIADLERDGAEALHATMVDMYRDEPLDRQEHDHDTLLESFPVFDGPDHYWRIPAPRNFRRRYPTPHCFVIGGMRQRLFEPLPITQGSSAERLLRRSCDIAGPLQGDWSFRLSAALIRSRLRPLLRSTQLYNCSKIPLVKWRRGMTYYNGAHALSRQLDLGRHRGVLLHFKFASGMGAARYLAERGEHTGGGKFYRRMIEQHATATRSPAFEGTVRFEESTSLGRLLA